MGRKLAPVLGECKHMFDPVVDTERAFGHRESMDRTYVRRRRTVAVVAVALVAVLTSPLAAGAVRRGGPSAPAAPQAGGGQAGGPLWGIAERGGPGGGPRPVSGQNALT